MRLQVTTQALQLVRHATSLLSTVRYIGRDLAELVKLEAKLAVGSAISIVLLGIAIGLLLFTGWILLISSLVAWVANDWLSLPAALLVIGLIVIATVLPLLFMIRRHAGNLDFKATRRQLGILHDETTDQSPRPN